jgi:cyclopropane fatty-acyl-phospholipid synthase-like methyltransferase
LKLTIQSESEKTSTQAAPPPTRSANSRRVVEYFDGINWDVRLFWTDSTTLGIHFGYWEADTRSHRDALVNNNRVLAEQAGLKPGMLVLDAGCGFGGSAIWMAEHFGVQVTGVTLSRNQAVQAKRSAAQRGVEHLTDFVVLDYSRMGLPEAAYDVVWAQESVCYAWDKHEFLAEAFRVLRPGGRLTLADGFRTARPFSEPDEKFLLRFAAGWGTPDYVTPDEFTFALYQVGFIEVDFTDATGYILPTVERLRRIASLTIPPARILRRLHLLSYVRLQNAESCYALHDLVERKLGIYGIVRACKPEKRSMETRGNYGDR